MTDVFKAVPGSHWFKVKYRNEIAISTVSPVYPTLSTQDKFLLDAWHKEGLIDSFQYIEGLELLKQLKRKK